MAMYLFFWTFVILIAVRMFKKYFIRSGAFKSKEDTALQFSVKDTPEAKLILKNLNRRKQTLNRINEYIS
jgi:hypothetical protein